MKIKLVGGPFNGEEIECPHGTPSAMAMTCPVWEEGTANLIGWAVYSRIDDDDILEFVQINADVNDFAKDNNEN